MKRFVSVLVLLLSACSANVKPPLPPAMAEAIPPRISWPSGLPVYDHIVIVVEENKDYEQIIDNPAAPYINGTLKAEGASLTQMFAEEHHSQGNYFWLFSGSNQNVGFSDKIPKDLINARNLGRRLIDAGRSFKGYSEDLQAIGSTVSTSGLYARKHVPWISFSDLPDDTTVAGSSNLRFQDFPASFSDLPTVSFVIPNLINDMHDGSIPGSVTAGDTWLRQHLADYYQWAKQNNSLLILTFDENDKKTITGGLTDPAASKPKDQNRIATILAGAHVKPGEYNEWKGVTHVNLLRTLEAMYGLEKSGAQQPFALAAGITDDFIITNVFTTVP